MIKKLKDNEKIGRFLILGFVNKRNNRERNQAPVKQKTSISDIYKDIDNGIVSNLFAQGLFLFNHQ